jgi:peptidoglycan/xylan/chitin deacetylase (PgdA/CDA1 family)
LAGAGVDWLRFGFTRGRSLIYERLFSRRMRVQLERPIYSFTFDDVPESAMRNGVPVLESVGAFGTFYVSAKLGEKEGRGRFLSLAGVAALHRGGHHIACHTYSHYELAEGSAREMMWDAQKNRLILSEALGGDPIDHFSYPFGMVTLRAKRLLRAAYKTLRGNRSGINYGVVDLTCLRSAKLYSRVLDRKHISRMISANTKVGGWLIFYTHGVEKEPGVWDISTDDLRWVVGECVRMGGEILSIRGAYERIEEAGRRTES